MGSKYFVFCFARKSHAILEDYYSFDSYLTVMVFLFSSFDDKKRTYVTIWCSKLFSDKLLSLKGLWKLVIILTNTTGIILRIITWKLNLVLYTKYPKFTSLRKEEERKCCSMFIILIYFLYNTIDACKYGLLRTNISLKRLL